MGWFSKKPGVEAQEIVALRREMDDLRKRLSGEEQSRALLQQVAQRLSELDDLSHQVAQIDARYAKATDLDALNDTIGTVGDRLTTVSKEALAAKEQAVRAHERVSSVSAELANQLTELGRDIDGFLAANAAAKAATPVIAEQTIADEVLEQLSAAQVKLANEQARYEIAFRQDLASLADQVRRSRSGH